MFIHNIYIYIYLFIYTHGIRRLQREATADDVKLSQ